MSLGFFVLLLLGHRFILLLIGIFSNCFLSSKISLENSEEEERSTEKTTNTNAPLDVSSISDLVEKTITPIVGCGRAFCLLLSLYFVKGKKKKRKRADDDADDVSRNDFVVVLLHGCNEN